MLNYYLYASFGRTLKMAKMQQIIISSSRNAEQGRCDRSPRIAKSPRKLLANPLYANLGVIEALASTDARRGTC